jgi:GDPmannose 4,6-dehydratase
MSPMKQAESALGGESIGKVALVTGVRGQDGSYLSKLLKSKGYRVVGLIAKPGLNETRVPNSSAADQLVEFTHSSQREILEILDYHRPHEIYNLAARTSGEAMFQDPLGTADINGIFPARLLEAIKEVNPSIRLFQASSREVFGDAEESPQDENTSRRPRNPYGAAKLYADNMVGVYRSQYGIYACSGILYNHESPLRARHFVTRKVAKAAAEISLGLSSKLSLGDISARRDWGFAGDYVEAMWAALQQRDPEDFIIASGITHSIEDLCATAFAAVKLDYRKYITIDLGAVRPAEKALLVGNIKKASNYLNWAPTTQFTEMITEMVKSELDFLRQQSEY